jgi:hypothetical protein
MVQDELNSAMRKVRELVEARDKMWESHRAEVAEHESDVFELNKVKVELEACKAELWSLKAKVDVSMMLY